MMKLFAVRDVKADAYGAPHSVQTKGLALRAFADACLDERSELAKYPDDYMLYELGEYDPNSGSLKSHQVPEFVASARSVVDQAKLNRNKTADIKSPEVIG